MESKLNLLQSKISTKLSEKKILSDQLSDIDREIKNLSTRTINYNKAAAFCDVLIEKMNAASVEDIEKLVTETLQFIFERPYEFTMKPHVSRGSVTYNFGLKIDDREIDNIMDSEGGGIVSVISIIMRIVTILITDPPMNRLLVLDESLGMLSAQYIDNAARFIKQLGSKLGFKIVLVTHQEEFKTHADVVYEVTKGEVRLTK